MNVWQGEFPAHNTLDDGWTGTAPVGAIPANGYGLYEVDRQRLGVVRRLVRARQLPAGHRRPPDAVRPAGERKVMRGGSYLCHASYCRRYRVDARSSSEPDSTAGNVGFRLVRDGSIRSSRGRRR